MSSSPFRDELHALQSALSELQEENSSLRSAVSRQQEELETLRAQMPENIAAVSRRLAEENEELRARIAGLRMQLATRPPVQVQSPDVWAALERLFARLVGK